MIVQHITEGKKVVVVGHGEGSIYANVLFGQLGLGLSTSVRLMFIAPFADSMADSTTHYVTHSSDDAVASMAYYAGF